MKRRSEAADSNSYMMVWERGDSKSRGRYRRPALQPAACEACGRCSLSYQSENCSRMSGETLTSTTNKPAEFSSSGSASSRSGKYSHLEKSVMFEDHGSGNLPPLVSW